VPEDGPSAVAAFDGAVEVVPVVDPADRSVGRLLFVEAVDGVARGDFAKESEGSVEDAAIVAARDHEVSRVGGAKGLEQKGIGSETPGKPESGSGTTQVVESTKQDGGTGGNGGFNAERAVEHTAHAADEFIARAGDGGRIADRG